MLQQACPSWCPHRSRGAGLGRHGHDPAPLSRPFHRPGGYPDPGLHHYSILKEQIGAIMGNGQELICSGVVAAAKLVTYLERHPEIESSLSRGGARRYLTTDLTPRFQQPGQPVHGPGGGFGSGGVVVRGQGSEVRGQRSEAGYRTTKSGAR